MGKFIHMFNIQQGIIFVLGKDEGKIVSKVFLGRNACANTITTHSNVTEEDDGMHFLMFSEELSIPKESYQQLEKMII